MNTNTKIAKQGSKIAEIMGKRSQNICINMAQMNPALSIINNKIKPQRV